MAHSTLLVRKERPASWPLLSLGLRLGFALSLMSEQSLPFPTRGPSADNPGQPRYAHASCQNPRSRNLLNATLTSFRQTPRSRIPPNRALAVWIAWDNIVDPQVMDLPSDLGRQWRWLYTQLPVYRCCFSFVLCAYLWSGCLYIWNKTRIK